MARPPRRIPPADWDGLPALRAWRAVGGDDPRGVILLKGGRTPNPKSTVHRLEHAAADGGDVIAKRGFRETLAVETFVYRQILPGLAAPSLRFLGGVDDPDPRFAWIFIDAADGEDFDESCAVHRDVAARWLARLHGETEGLAALTELPDRGAAHYLEQLHEARQRIAACFENPALLDADTESLDAILRALDVVESHWCLVDETCRDAPRVLVHNDFASRNARIEGAGPAARVWVFDWEVAGVGVPGIDLVRVDTETYARAARDRWPGLDVARQARLGQLVRGCLAPIAWATWTLDTPWIEGPLLELGSYQRRLESFLAESGWIGGSTPARRKPVLATDAPHEHPAARAWLKLGRGDACPARVERLRSKKVSQVYRLGGVGPAGSVVAKRTSHDVAAIERRVYGDLLPRLPLQGLRLEGALDEPDACWLFLEDAGSARAEGPAARRILSAWLADLHTAAAPLAEELGLPERGAPHHRERLRRAYEPLREHLGNPALTPADRWVVRRLADDLARVDAQWADVEALCARMPRTLVHGDLCPANLHLRHGANGDELLVLDWEMAGVGPPAVDLVAVDPSLYAALVAPVWPGVTEQQVTRWQRVGRLLRTIVATSWESADLAFPWVEKPMVRLRVYRRELEEALEALAPDPFAAEALS